MGPVKPDHPWSGGLVLAAVFSSCAVAQTTPTAPAPAAAASAPASAASAPRGARPPVAPPSQRVEITGGRESDADQRRLSTAAKIVIGREEIERFGDSSVSEVLKRLPGVTTSGPPGRGGPPRMRGLGAGYTQILVDGQRAPAGFSLDQLTPEQLERIEIFRAPTAETGARAIGGTINIVLREAFRARLNDVRAGVGIENGKATPGLFWTHNDSRDNFIYNLTAGTFFPHGRPVSSGTTTDEDPDTGAVLGRESYRAETVFSRAGLNLNARLQWRGDGGDMLMLSPGLFATRGESHTRFDITEATRARPPGYDSGYSDSDNHSVTARLNLQWRRRLPDDWRLELGGHANANRGGSESLRHELLQGLETRTERVTSDSREHNVNLNGKLSRLLGSGADHTFVGGWEAERQHRDEERITLSNGVKVGSDDDDFTAVVQRLALYAQDEWTLSPNWSMHAGLRTESIRTRGENLDGTRPTNSSRVTTPLVHFLYKPDPKQRDQIRISLTRSYKSPTLNNLIARPSYSSRYSDLTQTNDATSPDRVGNAGLRPELATGIDVAVERYLAEGGVLSANVFVRRLTDYIRTVTSLQRPVDYPAKAERWVSRPENVGRASTAGIELEAKFRLDQLITDAPRIEVRSNVSAFRSRVDQVPGPDNRLDQQPPGTANLGLDYRIRGTPLTLGGNLNLTPSYRTQVSEIQALTTPVKHQLDVYALWVFDPTAQLRLNVTNLNAADYVTSSVFDLDTTRQRQVSTSRTYVNFRISLELKL